MHLSVNTHPAFWKDWKDVQKHHKTLEFQSIYTPDEFSAANDDSKMESIIHLRSIKNIVINATNDGLIEEKARKYDRQPFLQVGWTIRKMRLGIDDKGQSHGLRIIFCLNDEYLLFVFVATKNRCDDERKMEKVFLQRISEYVSV
mgnify:CR=1 FL=1